MKYKTSFCLSSAVLSFHLFVTLPAAYAGTYPDDPSALSIVTSTIDADRYKEIYKKVYNKGVNNGYLYGAPVYGVYNDPSDPSSGIAYKSWAMPSITTAFPEAGSIGGVVLNGENRPVFSVYNPETDSFENYSSSGLGEYISGAYAREYTSQQTVSPDGTRYFFFGKDRIQSEYDATPSISTVVIGSEMSSPVASLSEGLLLNSYFIGNSAVNSSGGVIAWSPGESSTIVDNVQFLFNFSSNQSAGYFEAKGGGALFVNGGILNITPDEFGGVVFAGNVVGELYTSGYIDGGAIAHFWGELNIKNTIFLNNFAGTWEDMKNNAYARGGAIFSWSMGDYKNISNSDFYGNGASRAGGAIYFEKPLNLTDVVFSDNFVYNTDYGGAIYAGTSLTISAINRDSVFTLNKVNLKDIETTGPQYNDIYLANNATLQLNAAAGRSIIMQGGINSDGSTGRTITIGDSSGTYTGTVSISGQFNENFKGSVTVNSGTLQLGLFPDQFTFFGGDVSFAEGTTLDNRGTLTLTDKVTFAGNTTISNAGNLTVTADSNIETVSQIVNSGELILQTSLSQEIKGSGTTIIDTDMTLGYAMENAIFVNTEKSLTIDAANLLNGIGNDGTLTLGSGTLTEGITGQGSTVITGDVSIEGAVTNAVTVDAGRSLTIGADDLLGSVSNEGSLVLTGGTLQSEVSGTSGMVVVDGSVVSDALINNGVSINAQKSLTAAADDIKGDVSNEGILTLTDGTFGSYVSGSGLTVIEGDVVSTRGISNAVKVNPDSTFQISANNLFSGVENNGLLTLTSGALEQAISGTGRLVIDGYVVAGSDLLNDVTLNSARTLEVSADNLHGIVTNEDGFVRLTGGTLSNGITGQGDTFIVGDVTTNAGITNTVTVESQGSLRGQAQDLGSSLTVNAGGVAHITGGELSSAVYGDGRVALSGSLTAGSGMPSFYGDVVLSDGVLVLTRDADFGKASVEISSGLLDVGAYQMNSQSLSFGGSSDLTLTVSNASGTVQSGSVFVADTITVSEGAKLNFVLNGYNLKPGESGVFTILSGESVTDNFEVTDNDRFSFEKVEDGVYRITSLREPLASGGTTNNQNTASAWDQVDLSGNTTVSQLAKDLAEMSSDSGRQKEYLDTLTAIAPRDTPVVASMVNKHVNSVMNVIGTRLAVLRQDALQSNKNQMMQKTLDRYSDDLEQGRSGGSVVDQSRGSVWAQGMYDYAKLNGEYGFSSNTYGGVIGVDFKTDSFKLGVGYAYTEGDVDEKLRTTDVDNSTVFVYSEYYHPTGYYMNVTGSYNFGNYAEEKLTDSYHIQADYGVEALGLQALIGRNFGIFTPELGVRYVSYTQDKYTDDLGQTVSKVRSDTFTAVLGTKIGTAYNYGPKEALIPEFRLAATYDFATDDTRGLVTMFDGTGYVINYDNLDELSVEAGFGLTYRSSNVEVGINYDARFRKDYQEHTGMLNFRYNF